MKPKQWRSLSVLALLGAMILVFLNLEVRFIIPAFTFGIIFVILSKK